MALARQKEWCLSWVPGAKGVCALQGSDANLSLPVLLFKLLPLLFRRYQSPQRLPHTSCPSQCSSFLQRPLLAPGHTITAPALIDLSLGFFMGRCCQEVQLDRQLCAWVVERWTLRPGGSALPSIAHRRASYFASLCLSDLIQKVRARAPSIWPLVCACLPTPMLPRPQTLHILFTTLGL